MQSQREPIESLLEAHPARLDDVDTVFLDESQGFPTAAFIDQRLLPAELVVKRTYDVDEAVEAIVTLGVRGAPAIGVFAALAAYAIAHRLFTAASTADEERPPQHLLDDFLDRCHKLANARPTAVNLAWAVNRMRAAAAKAVEQQTNCERFLDNLRSEALSIHHEDIAACRAIGENGARLLRQTLTRGTPESPIRILTHCNAGRLATVRYGTATAPIYVGREQGLSFKVYCDETRPLLQGARLTAYELAASGFDTYVQCDNAAASLMRAGKVDAVFVGCDRVAANGDFANKVGTSMVALAARHYGVPFYVCAPTSTIDPATACGTDIVIEQRDGSEVTSKWYERPMAPSTARVYNPAFDVTDANLVTAFITERGVLAPPFNM